MHTNHKKEDPLVELGYEHRDVDYPKLIKAVVIFFIFTLICFGSGYAYYSFKFPANKRMTVKSQTAIPRPVLDSNVPRLQDNVQSKSDIMTLRKQEYDRLHGVGAIEGQPGKYHIPVDQAMDLILERGLPKAAEVPVER